MEEIVFKARVDTGNSLSEVEKIDKSLKEAGKTVSGDFNKRMDELKAKVEGGGMSMRELSKAIREYQSIAMTAGRESAVGQQAINAAAELYDEMEDLRNEVMRLSDDQKTLQGTLQIGQGVIAGYGAVQSAIALVGSENEALEKSLQKLMAVQTLLNSVLQIRQALEKESAAMLLLNNIRTKAAAAAQAVYTLAVGTTTGAMKALRIAMLAIPFVAIAAGVMGLVSAMEWFFSSTEEAEKAVNSFNKAMAETSRRIEEMNQKSVKNAQQQIDLLTAQGASEKELHEARLDLLEKEEAARKKSISVQAIELQGLNLKYKMALNQGNRDLAREIKEELSQQREKYRSLRALEGDYQNKVAVEKAAFETKQTAEEEKARADRSAKWKAAQEKKRQEEEKENQLKIERERLISEYLLAQIDDENIIKLDKLRMSHQQQRDELVKKFGQDTELLKALTIQQNAELAKTQEEIRLSELAKDKEARQKAFEEKQRDKAAGIQAEMIKQREDFEMQQELAAELAFTEMESALAQENLTANEKLLIQAQYEEKLDALRKARVDKEKETAQAIMAGTMDAQSRTNDAVQSLSDAFFAVKLSNAEKGSAKELAIQKKQFEINKKLQIAQAIMQGVQAVQAAYSSGSAIPVIGAVMGPVFAALAAVAATANVVKIKNTKFEGGGSGGGAISAPSAVGVPSLPDPNEGNSTLTGGLQGSGTPPQQTKVVLIDSEVKAALDHSSKVETLSTVG